MKTCIPVTENRGLQSRINEHFGKSPCHAIVDIETRTVEVLDKNEGCDGHCAPIPLLIEKGVKLVLCKKIGQSAADRFRQSGIQVKRTTAFTVQEALVEQSLRFLPDITEKDLCHKHHHHEHGSGGGHCADQGSGA
jgi:predicted Fe-Mo cluster-binding NifX family protein